MELDCDWGFKGVSTIRRKPGTATFGGQFLESGLKLTSIGRSSQKRPDDAEAKNAPIIRGTARREPANRSANPW